MPKAFTEREKKLIGERLLKQGHKQFSTHGLKKTNVQELAEAAGISKGAFYLFYESKEALFMDVIEEVEKDYRKRVLASIDLPGPSPRARLFTILKTAFTLLKTIPLLQTLAHGEYDTLVRRVPAETFQEHMASDDKFLKELVARCREAGIPIQARTEQIRALLYALVFTSLHEDDFGAGNIPGITDLLLELIAAFCLGEVVTQIQNSVVTIPQTAFK